MTPIAVRAEEGSPGELRFRAMAGGRQHVGRTMGEALDALVADWGEELPEAAVLIQRFRPDAHFTETQFQRMQDLLARRSSLSTQERQELEGLIDAELDATIARTESIAAARHP